MPTEGREPPVRCVKCGRTAVILSKTFDKRTEDHRWRLRCLDCAVAWWADEHDHWKENPPVD
ncbi:MULTISPECIES: hypothetical protein [unclassified Streptomyces]|uniref:hypothetical protein n=1 Tax=unclassified Streptomyces TaxID=2593676 RepID=UPI0016604152|nr:MULTISPECIES: hypothetical protein [unclassified Streptomyces]MBD0707243.1 hypothetical protein [Streptomyces sp. CBMA291]MBD0713731.1 hypothetical protein [Streptomyces sp. CBMA370]